MRSSPSDQVFDLRRLDVARIYNGVGQSLEMSLATLYLGVFLLADVLGEQTAFGLDHEIHCVPRKEKQVATIHADQKVVTQINVFEVDPKNQDELARLLVEAGQYVSNMQG